MFILVFNAGSTSLKFGLFADSDCGQLASGSLDWAGGDRHHALLTLRTAQQAARTRTVDVPEDPAAVGFALEVLAEAKPGGTETLAAIGIVGHRVVHGGADFPQSVLIDEAVRESIARWSELRHCTIRRALAAIAGGPGGTAARTASGGLRYGLFCEPAAAVHVYPLPYAWYADWGVRRFGFHGISHQYCAARAAEIVGRDPVALRIVNCHLGGGCSAAAIRGGSAVAMTMGFTPLEGLMMATRPGSLDPGILPHVQRRPRVRRKTWMQP